MKIGVLSLQGAISEHLNHIERCGAQGVAVKRPKDLENIDGLIVPGGESTAIGNLMEEHNLIEAIMERHREGMAAFGTCGGMVLLSKNILNGKENQPRLALIDVEVRRNSFGRQRESFEVPLQVKGIDTPVIAVFIRAPVITRAGPEVEILSSLEEGPVVARQDKALIAAFHPEVTSDIRMHQYFLDMCK